MPPTPQEEEPHPASCSCCEGNEVAGEEVDEEEVTCRQDQSIENFLEDVGCSVYLELFTQNKVNAEKFRQRRVSGVGLSNCFNC